ncbi:MAG: hypothetical protein DMF88_10870 [Acidobacteria bacterium]|nr:MAG: hypothetical protein DMF88_10870 [Acidobacteriota bacterium]
MNRLLISGQVAGGRWQSAKNLERSFLPSAPCYLFKLLYAASTNISVVHGPDVFPYLASYSRVGLAALTCASVIPLLIMS